MASLVSSEYAFSQGGITISKWCSRFKGNIVEALQCIKCALCHDLLFCEPGPSSLIEGEYDEYELEVEAGDISEDEVEEVEYGMELDIEMSGPYE